MANSLYPVAKKSDFREMEPIYADAGGLSVGVYLFRGKFYAYADVCPHQGGPACGGGVFGNVESKEVDGKRKALVSTDHFSLACPWHGIEFDIETGNCLPRKDWRLASLETLVDGDDVMVKK